MSTEFVQQSEYKITFMIYRLNIIIVIINMLRAISTTRCCKVDIIRLNAVNLDYIVGVLGPSFMRT